MHYTTVADPPDSNKLLVGLAMTTIAVRAFGVSV
jgi:hypothetical protein